MMKVGRIRLMGVCGVWAIGAAGTWPARERRTDGIGLRWMSMETRAWDWKTRQTTAL